MPSREGLKRNRKCKIEIIYYTHFLALISFENKLSQETALIKVHSETIFPSLIKITGTENHRPTQTRPTNIFWVCVQSRQSHMLQRQSCLVSKHIEYCCYVI